MMFRLFSFIKNWCFLYRLKVASANERAEMMRGKFYFLGKNVELYTTSFGTEPYLISIHDNVICAANVRFITHDVSCFNMARIAHVEKSEVDKVGPITLYENAFVGAFTILLPNTSVGKNSVVAAGSVVTKCIPDGEVWGGVPAKYIMDTSDYCDSVLRKSKEYPWMCDKSNHSQDEIIKMKQTYFFENE